MNKKRLLSGMEARRQPKKKGPKPKFREPGQFNLTGEKEEIEASKKAARESGWTLSELIMALLREWRAGRIAIQRREKGK